MRNTRKLNRRRIKRKPFWLPASSFYFLVAGFSAATFFLIIGIFHDDAREPEIVVAGLTASSVLIAGVILRELILRNVREQFIAEQKQLDANLSTAFASIADAPPSKLTLERNAAAVRNIKVRSEAAMVFESIAQGHREVFELCAEYRKVVAHEIRSIHPDSPRLKALIQGNEFALRTHKFHILKWAELESKPLAVAAQQSKEDPVRIEFLERAKRPLEVALGYYPEEPALRDSLDVIEELLITVRLKDFIAAAESAATVGDNGTALALYRDALSYIESQSPGAFHDGLRARITQAMADIKA